MRHKQGRARAIRFGTVFLIACVVAYGLEYLAESLAANGEHEFLHQSLLTTRGVYERLVTTWPRPLESRIAAIVKIEPGPSDPLAVSADNVCEQRGFLARLIPTLVTYSPSVIVIDKYFTVGRCAPDNENTKKLIATVADAANRHISVIVGLRIREDEAPAINIRSSGYGIEPPLTFPVGLDVREGILNIDRDFRRLPLGWTIERVAHQRPVWRNSLSIEAATAYEPNILNKQPLLRNLIARRANPYISFVTQNKFVIYSASDVLCAAGNFEEYASICQQRNNAAISRPALRGRIVFVAEYDKDRDLHTSVFGPIYGVLLQANYVEAILDGRYYQPAHSWVNYLVGFLLFLGLKTALHRQSVFRALAGVAVIIIVLFTFLFLTVRLFGYFIDPVASSVVLLVLLIFWAFERYVRTTGAES